MLNQFYELAEMLSSCLFILFIIKMIHLSTLIIINFSKIEKIHRGKDNE